MPIAAGGSTSGAASACRHADSVACQICSGSCSTQPGRGKCWANSSYPRAAIRPSAVTSSAVTPVVPASMARTVMWGSLRICLGGLEAELLEHDRIDATCEHALLEVLDPGPVAKRGVEVVLNVADRGKSSPHLLGELAFQGQCSGRVGFAEVEVVEVEQSAELGHRSGGVVDA